MKKIFFALLVISSAANVTAQNKSTKEQKRAVRQERITAMVKQEEEGVITFRKHFLGGIKLTSDGYGGFIEIGRAQSVRKSLLFQLDISERKHPKEEKQYSPISNGSGPFIYGKINFFYPVKLGVQQQYLLGNKGNKNGVSISANAGGGITLGLLRPYLLAFDSAGTQVFKGAEDTANFIFGVPIGGPNLGTGFNKLKVTPGIYAKTGVRFDYGKYNEMISALEVGLVGEFYSKAIPQMVFNKENKFFFSAYVSILFGKRK